MSRRRARGATVSAVLVVLVASAGVAEAARPRGSLMSFGDATKLPLESELRKLLPIAKLGCQAGLALPGISGLSGPSTLPDLSTPAAWAAAKTPTLPRA